MHVLYYPALDEVLVTVLQQSKPFNFKMLYTQKTDKKMYSISIVVKLQPVHLCTIIIYKYLLLMILSQSHYFMALL